MNPQRKLSDKIWLVIKGIAMGAANKVPGVSGGVIAFVAGFYEEFIYSLQRVNARSFALLRQEGFRAFYKNINGGFLSLLITGMVISYFSVSQLLDYALVHYELYVWSGFFGMIVGSIYFIAKDFGHWRSSHGLYLFIGALVGLGISFLEPARENDHLWFVFFCGIISVSGMTLPGLSGSFILMLLGNYVLLLVDSVNALFKLLTLLVQGDLTQTIAWELWPMIKILIVFSLGSLVGLVSFSHLLAAVLKSYRKQTYAVIIGFIAGSLGVVWPWKTKIFATNSVGTILKDANGREIIKDFDRYLPQWDSAQTYWAIGFIGLGIAIVVALELLNKQKKVQKNG
jgi:putative membrane protein